MPVCSSVSERLISTKTQINTIIFSSDYLAQDDLIAIWRHLCHENARLLDYTEDLNRKFFFFLNVVEISQNI